MNDFLIVYLLSLIFINILFTVYVCRNNQNVYSVLVWLLIFFVLPVISHIGYFFIGRGVRLGTRKKFLNKFSDSSLDSAMLDSADNVSFIDSGLNLDSELIQFNINYNKAALAVFNEVKFYTNTSELYNQILKDVSEAKFSINIQFFIYRNDLIGNQLRQLLESKASQGVKVRVLLDSLGSINLGKKFFDKLKQNGGSIQFFMQVMSTFNVNYRNHRKIIVVDNSICYTGSANIGDEYTIETNRNYNFFDLMMRMTGDIVPLINLRFFQDWNYCNKIKISQSEIIPAIHKIEEVSPMQLISSGPNTLNEEIKHTYMKLIYNASSRVWISTPYYIPDSSFTDCIVAAIERGVDVKVIVPGTPDKKLVYLATNSHISRLIKSGADVYKHPSFMHAKILIIDDKVVSVGTFNIDIRSFRLHFEHTILMYGLDIINTVSDIYKQMLTDSIKLDYKYLYNKSLLQKAGEGLMNLFSPLF